MLACMCDLIVAADDARFSNPVLRMSGVGVELLVEPWELGPRKAKEFLFCAQEFGAGGGRALRAREPGRAARRSREPTHEMAEQVALVPPLTAEAVKASINHMVDLMGQRESWRYHFMLHQFVSNTPTALAKVEARKAGGMDAVKKEQGRDRDRSARGPARPRSRHAHRRAVLRGPARRAGRRGHQDRTAAAAATSCARSVRSSTATRCSGRSRAAAARA